jgi:hypothetical protein
MGTLAVVAVATLALSACGSSGGNNNSSGGSKLSDFINNLKAGQKATFGATWTYTSNGTTHTVSLSNNPPKTAFQVDSAVVIDNGTNTYYCATQKICVKGGSAGALAALSDIFNGHTVLTTIQSYTDKSVLSAEGITLTFSNATYGGVASTCLEVKSSSSTVTWCAGTDTGILTYYSTSDATFTLTSYTSSPPASDFQPPAGATVVSL